MARLAQANDWLFQYPLGLPDRVPGDGCYIRHGYACENAIYYPGLWHTGENWYVQGADAAGALVYATAAGEIVFAGYDYPGPVVLIKHADDLYSQYGHLDYQLNIEVGQHVERGYLIGTVLLREDMRSHLHFELRTFYTTPEVNGDNPRYDFYCGFNCPPGPGYWPMNAPEHPSAMGWRDPLHVITWRMGGGEVMVPANIRDPLFIFESPQAGSHVDSVSYPVGTTFPLLEVWAGDEATTNVGANATTIWYQIRLPDRESPAWVPALNPTMDAIQSDGQTTSFVFALIPAIS
ncbi:MAG: M23 family metallopeptidase [Thermomicrobiales bacterium]|nr:M23 family metallopeptidase [Thermomicrobiales bacterium]